MGGFFGVVSSGDCVSDLYFGIDYHSHLGTRRGGIAVARPDGGIDRRIHDISNSQFRSKFDDEIGSFKGSCGIGVISDTEDQPLIITSQLGTFALTTVAKINNIDEIIEQGFSSGCSHLSESGDGEPNPTEVVAMLISRSNTISGGIEYAQRVIDGSCSMLILKKDRIYAARDRYGRTPVIIGRKTGAFAVTMETTAFPNLDFEAPGEFAGTTKFGCWRLRFPRKPAPRCRNYRSTLREG